MEFSLAEKKSFKRHIQHLVESKRVIQEPLRFQDWLHRPGAVAAKDRISYEEALTVAGSSSTSNRNIRLLPPERDLNHSFQTHPSLIPNTQIGTHIPHLNKNAVSIQHAKLNEAGALSIHLPQLQNSSIGARDSPTTDFRHETSNNTAIYAEESNIPMTSSKHSKIKSKPSTIQKAQEAIKKLSRVFLSSNTPVEKTIVYENLATETEPRIPLGSEGGIALPTIETSSFIPSKVNTSYRFHTPNIISTEDSRAHSTTRDDHDIEDIYSASPHITSADQPLFQHVLKRPAENPPSQEPESHKRARTSRASISSSIRSFFGTAKSGIENESRQRESSYIREHSLQPSSLAYSSRSVQQVTTSASREEGSALRPIEIEHFFQSQSRNNGNRRQASRGIPSQHSNITSNNRPSNAQIFQEPFLSRVQSPIESEFDMQSDAETIRLDSHDPISEDQVPFTQETAIDHLVEHLSIGLFSNEEQHENDFEKHCANDGHKNCQTIEYLRDLSDPSLPHNSHIPDLLRKPFTFYRGAAHCSADAARKGTKRSALPLMHDIPPHTFRQQFEGIQDDDETPPNICFQDMQVDVRSPAPRCSVDWDSLVGELDSFSAIKGGISFQPYATPVKLMNSRVQGVFVRFPDPNDPSIDILVPPEEIPQAYIGSLIDWSAIKIHLLCPASWIKRQKLPKSQRTIILTAETLTRLNQYTMKALSVTCHEDVIKQFPDNFHFAKTQAEANYFQNRNGGIPHSRFTDLSVPVSGNDLREFDRQFRRLLDADDDLRDARIFITGKGFKSQFFHRSYTALGEAIRDTMDHLFDAQYMDDSKYFLDIGRQFRPGQAQTTLLWKKTDLDHYYHARATRFGHGPKQLTRTVYNMAGCRDIGQLSLTATRDSPQALLPHSAFYSTTKNKLMSTTIKPFQSRDTDIIAYGEAHTATIARAGHGRTITPAAALVPFIHSKNSSSEGIDILSQNEWTAREEHRVAGSIIFDVLSQLAEIEATDLVDNDAPHPDLGAFSDDPDEPQDAQLALTPIYRHYLETHSQAYSYFQRQVKTAKSIKSRREALIAEDDLRYELGEPQIGEYPPLPPSPDPLCRSYPFYSIKSSVYAGFLRGRCNLAVIGFERCIGQINGNTVSPELTSTTNLFLERCRYSLLSESIQLAPILYLDKWRSRPQKPRKCMEYLVGKGYREVTPESQSEIGSDEEAIIARNNRREGMGGAKMMKEYGYDWWLPKMDWDTFLIRERNARHFFVNESDFMIRHRARAKDIKVLAAGDSIIRLWESRWRRKLVGTQERTLLDFAIGYITVLFRGETWKHLQRRGKLHPHIDPTPFVDGLRPITMSNLGASTIEGIPQLATSNKSVHKGKFTDLLRYIFTNDEFIHDEKPRLRKGWDQASYRKHFEIIRRALYTHLSEDRVEKWQRDLFCTIVATNPVLPVPDGTVPISRRKPTRNLRAGYIWSSYTFPSGLPKGAVHYEDLRPECLIPENPLGARECYDNKPSRVPFDGTPPILLYETQYHMKSLSKVEALLDRALYTAARERRRLH